MIVRAPNPRPPAEPRYHTHSVAVPRLTLHRAVAMASLICLPAGDP